jgi:hypothetical protein
MDLDNDVLSDMVVWRPSDGTFRALTSQSGFNPASALVRQWGTAGDVPLPDTNLDGGGSDMVVWRPSDGTFYALTSQTGFDPASALVRQWGTEGDLVLT